MLLSFRRDLIQIEISSVRHLWINSSVLVDQLGLMEWWSEKVPWAGEAQTLRTSNNQKAVEMSMMRKLMK